MPKKILVSLVSDQTIPNIELIKEFKSEIDKYLFISTDQKQNQLQWIVATSGIDEYDEKTVNPFDIGDIEKQLTDYDYGDDEIILNITGGTKLMSIISSDFFRKISATIYYLTGHDKSYIKIFPNRGKRNFVLNQKLTLQEYLSAYGFAYNEPKPPYKQFQIAKNILNFFVENDMELLKNIFEPIRIRRGKKMNVEKDILIHFLNAVNYPYNDRLKEKDTKYLSGDWFEEYVYCRIKEELKLSDNEIATGIIIKKENNRNEIDVIFIHNHKLYVIECKTSIFDHRKIKRMREGKEVEELKSFNLLPEIIYKSDALRSKFGLFANTSIFTLEEIKNKTDDPKDNFKTHFDRAELSKITIVSKRDILSGKSIKELLKIK